MSSPNRTAKASVLNLATTLPVSPPPSGAPSPEPAMARPLPATSTAVDVSNESVTTAPSATATLPSSSEAPKRRRRGGKRVKFQHLPRPPLPVRALWTAASELERQQAHKATSVMLAYWLGKIGKGEAAVQLSVSELRVWQLSQQALAGMAAGLLTQPRTRARPTPLRGTEDDPAMLKRRIAQLQRELSSATRLVELLKELPAHRASALPPAAKEHAGTRPPTARAGKTGTRSRREGRGLREGTAEPAREPAPPSTAPPR